MNMEYPNNMNIYSQIYILKINLNPVIEDAQR